ncbi:SRPBCC domain-containing protein [Saccharothrix xinjiangensis]|uniref:SRPBCC domain-containing protein n=1 Tax=Saccharothrix xinjiangensis TaxID=204798 RepID=A0ABV9XQ23_9PSEU
MGFPDRIERTLELAHPPRAVWDALTTAEGLGSWFGNEATVDLSVGGVIRLSWEGGHAVDLRVERVEEPSVFGFTWPVDGLPEDERHRTYVEFTLEPVDGGTRLVAVETGFARLPEDAGRKAHDAHVQGWKNELADLAAHLDAA